MNASVNIYVFHGGTSFGFGSGSNYDGTNFQPCPTSYDYDAPLNEAGDPTPKYHDLRAVIGKYLPLSQLPVPVPAPKMKLDPISLRKIDNYHGQDTVQSQFPLTFEELSVRHGFVLYSTVINVQPSDPAVLSIPGLKDRAHVYVDSVFQGILSRMEKITSMPITAKKGSTLQILVENQGRICFGSDINEQKGITGKTVNLGPIGLTNWTNEPMYKNWDSILATLEERLVSGSNHVQPLGELIDFPSFFGGTFSLPPTLEPDDTFLEMKGWSKGMAFVNGFNLGRYWPVVGPQLTLYAPKHLFKPFPAKNVIILLELEHVPQIPEVQFVDYHIINGSIPYFGTN
jgi:beta-galactosidase